MLPFKIKRLVRLGVQISRNLYVISQVSQPYQCLCFSSDWYLRTIDFVSRVCLNRTCLLDPNLQHKGVYMAHHYSGPDFGFPHGDARLDFTDLYAFPKPGDAGKSILIMNVHPSFGVNPPGPTTAEPFAPEALYELKIDTDGDAVADIAYRVRFSPSEGGAQTAILRRI